MPFCPPLLTTLHLTRLLLSSTVQHSPLLMLVSIFLWVQLAVTAVGCLGVCQRYMSGTTDLERSMSSCTVALKLLADVLHFPQELLAVAQTEVRLAVRAVQLLVLTEEDIVVGAILFEIPVLLGA